MNTLTQLVKPTQQLCADKVLTFTSSTGVTLSCLLCTDRDFCCPVLHENGEISNLSIYVHERKVYTSINIRSNPIPYIVKVDTDDAGFLIGAILREIDGVKIPNFVNNETPGKEEYIYGTKETEHIVVIRNGMRQEICSGLYLHAALTLDWVRNTVKTSRGVYLSPRVMNFQGDNNAKDQTYNGISNSLSPWDIPTQTLRNCVQEKTGVYYNAGLYNYYTNGTDYVSDHADKEALDGNVWGLSLGGARDFRFRRLADKKIFPVKLHHGDVVQMRGLSIQREWHHGVPKRLGSEPRISITFRWVGTKPV